jgi:hypothetical protein
LASLKPGFLCEGHEHPLENLAFLINCTDYN